MNSAQILKCFVKIGLTVIWNHKLHADSDPGRTVYNLRQDHGVFDRNLTTQPGQLSS